ncbi:MAG: L-aspartate oxidase [Cytophagales bacterium]|nr:L-aspartate oxidase [Cytophagales bacterium]
MMQTDVLVIGSGIAGLSYAIKVATHLPEAKVTLITKASDSETNTKYAQGGIAVKVDDQYDSFEKHITDTLQAGDDLCNRQVVECVVKEAPVRVKELVRWGVTFDKQPSGTYALRKEGGHSVKRVIHHKDITGLEVERKLLHQVKLLANVTLLQHHFVVDLITQHHLKNVRTPQAPITCYGAYALNQKSRQIITILSRITLLATGGCGQVYSYTTNPTIATGDGVALAYRAKARVRHMEFIQFHPTALYDKNQNPAFLISEAVRGAGAQLLTQDGKPFMHKYDQRKELASRDIVARAIDFELKTRGDEYVFLDCRHLETELFHKRFPHIGKQFKRRGINPQYGLIPVVPAAHYQCGGVDVNLQGETCINHLYACGECTHTGLHGANRLASNALLEALVYAHHCYVSTVRKLAHCSLATNVPDWDAQGTTQLKEMVLIAHNRRALQNTMSDYVGIVRSNERLHFAMKRINMFWKEIKRLYDKNILSTQLCELRNLVTVAHLIVQQSIERKKNSGGFYNVDFA